MTKYTLESNGDTPLGMSNHGDVLVVAHTMRGERVRIISARKATPREKRWYEKERA